MRCVFVNRTWQVIVFSQWTSMLDLLEIPFKAKRIVYRRLDGTMPVTAREKAIGDFESQPDVLVLLVSLKVGGGRPQEVVWYAHHAAPYTHSTASEAVRQEEVPSPPALAEARLLLRGCGHMCVAA